MKLVKLPTTYTTLNNVTWKDGQSEQTLNNVTWKDGQSEQTLHPTYDLPSAEASPDNLDKTPVMQIRKAKPPRKLAKEIGSPPTSSIGAMRKTWFMSYEVKRNIFPESLIRNLDEQVPLTNRIQSGINNALYNDVTRYTFLITGDAYKAVIKSLCKLFPYLKDKLHFIMHVINKYECHES